mgnify:CR=1 FL=1
MPELTDHEMILEIHADVADIKESVGTIRKTLYGNGNIDGGLVSRQNVLTGRIDTISKLLTFVGGPLVAAILVYLVGLLVK